MAHWSIGYDEPLTDLFLDQWDWSSLGFSIDAYTERFHFESHALCHFTLSFPLDQDEQELLRFKIGDLDGGEMMGC